MKPSSVIRSRVNRDRGADRPSTVSTRPSGARMMRWSRYVPGSGGTKSSGGRGSSDARARTGQRRRTDEQGVEPSARRASGAR